MNLVSVIERIRQQAPAFRLVGGAAQFERVASQLAAHPAAFVLPAAEAAADSPFASQIVQQELTCRFAVLLAVRNLADDEGAAAVESLEPVRTAVRQALLGWTPQGCESGCTYVRGELLAFANGVLWWHDFYLTTFIIRST